jgi:phosphoribosylformylglycinamidine synthase PurS subunit
MVSSMKARVFVILKPTVLDPQGQTIRSALNGLGHKSITEVRQGKYFDIDVDRDAPREKTIQEIETIASEVLSNPVIEEYRVEIID